MLVFVVSVTVRAHLVQFKLIANNKTDDKWVLKYGIMYLMTCARFSSRLYSYIVIICDDLLLLLLRHVWGGGGAR